MATVAKKHLLEAKQFLKKIEQRCGLNKQFETKVKRIMKNVFFLAGLKNAEWLP